MTRSSNWATEPPCAREPRKTRVCVPTSRSIARRPFQCGLYEAQDVLAEIEDVDLICLSPERGFRFLERWQRRLLYHDLSRQLIFQNPGLRKIRLTQEYDLLVVACQNHWDLLYFNAIEGWQERCKTTVCWLEEMWVADIPAYKYWLHALKRFDHVLVGCHGTVKALSDTLGRQCHWLPGGVDTLRFSPYPNVPARVIDIYSIGRRSEGIHRVLRQAAERGGIFYIYDTFAAADAETYDHRQHRELYANLAKRSRYFMVAPGKLDSPEIQHQAEIGYRFFEGAAAGTVMAGQAPDGEAFREVFNWQDVVIPIKSDGSDTLEVLGRLSAEPERIAAISRTNGAQALLRHDWVYRWKEIFRLAGIQPSPGMQARERRLKELAALALTEGDVIEPPPAASVEVVK